MRQHYHMSNHYYSGVAESVFGIVRARTPSHKPLVGGPGGLAAASGDPKQFPMVYGTEQRSNALLPLRKPGRMGV